jgi:anaphase-promoting complex subunit 3
MQSQQSESPPTYLPYLFKRFNTLIWACLDADLHKSAVFYAERYFALDHGNHDARHLYANVMLRANQPHSALHLVNLPQDLRCNGCLEIKAKCCSTLGRHRQAREALEDVLKNAAEVPSRVLFSIYESVSWGLLTSHSVTGTTNGADLSRGGCTTLPVWTHRTEGQPT